MAVVTRTTSFRELSDNLFGLLGEIAAAYGHGMEVAGWRAQLAHVAPSAWLDLQPSVTSTKTGRVEDRIVFELWLTAPSLESETSEYDALVELLDLALPLVDATVARTASRGLIGVDFVDRQGFAFRSASAASTQGDPGDIPALVIYVSVRWTATAC